MFEMFFTFLIYHFFPSLILLIYLAVINTDKRRKSLCGEGGDCYVMLVILVFKFCSVIDFGCLVIKQLHFGPP